MAQKEILKLDNTNYLTYKIKKAFREQSNKIIEHVKKTIELENSENKDKYLKNQFRKTFSDDYLKQIIIKAIDEQIEKNVTIDNKQYVFTGLANSMTYVHYVNKGSVPTHYDSYKEENVLYTGIIYLNDDYLGGETYLFDGEKKITIMKETGDFFCFIGSKIFHGCDQVVGEKHVLLIKLLYFPII